MRIVVAALALLLFASGCKSSEVAQLTSLGHSFHVRCYSGGVVIYEGDTTGNVSNEANSDGWYWQDAKTRKLVETSAQCVFTQE